MAVVWRHLAASWLQHRDAVVSHHSFTSRHRHHHHQPQSATHGINQPSILNEFKKAKTALEYFTGLWQTHKARTNKESRSRAVRDD